MLNSLLKSGYFHPLALFTSPSHVTDLDVLLSIQERKQLYFERFFYFFMQVESKDFVILLQNHHSQPGLFAVDPSPDCEQSTYAQILQYISKMT